MIKREKLRGKLVSSASDIKRNPLIFEYLLDYLRGSKVKFDDPTDELLLQEEMRYWQVEDSFNKKDEEPAES